MLALVMLLAGERAARVGRAVRLRGTLALFQREVAGRRTGPAVAVATALAFSEPDVAGLSTSCRRARSVGGARVLARASIGVAPGRLSADVDPLVGAVLLDVERAERGRVEGGSAIARARREKGTIAAS